MEIMIKSTVDKLKQLEDAIPNLISPGIRQLHLLHGDRTRDLMLSPYYLGYVKGLITFWVTSYLWRPASLEDTPSITVVAQRMFQRAFTDVVQSRFTKPFSVKGLATEALQAVLLLDISEDREYNLGLEEGRITGNAMSGMSDINDPRVIEAREKLRAENFNPDAAENADRLLAALLHRFLVQHWPMRR